MSNFKKVLSIVIVTIMILGMSVTAFASEMPDKNSKSVPRVSYTNFINNYDEFVFQNSLRSTDIPDVKWEWDKGACSIDGSSKEATLYSNYYFSDVVGRTFSFTAGYSNRISVDLVYKGLIVQSVVSTWTIDAGSTKDVTISSTDLDGKSENGNYYFRFNSDPLGHNYSVSGTFE